MSLSLEVSTIVMFCKRSPTKWMSKYKDVGVKKGYPTQEINTPSPPPPITQKKDLQSPDHQNNTNDATPVAYTVYKQTIHLLCASGVG